MIAMLGMYDMPALQDANDRFWQAIRAGLGYGPAHLTRDGDPWRVWQSSDLVFAQTCGMPYRTRLFGTVNLVGTPDYGLPGCAPGYYQSVLVVRADAPDAPLAAFAAGTFAYNEALSQSGWAAAVTHLSKQQLRPEKRLRTGSHAASARAVADGRADFAALDALTWELLVEHDPCTADLRVLERTAPTPGLPYITASRNDPLAVATAVEMAITDLAPGDRATLHLRALVRIPEAAYLAVPTPPGP